MSELFAYCSTAALRMPFSWQYTLSAPSVEVMGKVSKSVVATFSLTLAKVRCSIPSWLIAVVMALA
jgi:hypothetical protein